MQWQTHTQAVTNNAHTNTITHAGASASTLAVQQSHKLASAMDAMSESMRHISGMVSPGRKRLEVMQGPSSAGECVC